MFSLLPQKQVVDLENRCTMNVWIQKIGFDPAENESAKVRQILAIFVPKMCLGYRAGCSASGKLSAQVAISSCIK